MDHTGHQPAAMVRVYTRRADAFADHAGRRAALVRAPPLGGEPHETEADLRSRMSHQRYTPEFKDEAVRRTHTSGRRTSATA
jgi:hypothetical protein